jgi:hypothetical protein
VPVVDFDLSIYGAGCEAVAVHIEGCCFNHVFVAMLQEPEAFLLGVYRVVFHHLCHSFV